MSALAGTFALTVEDCRQILLKLTERVEDHFGIARDDVTLEDLGLADDVLYALREAARRSGIELDRP